MYNFFFNKKNDFINDGFFTELFKDNVSKDMY